MPNWRLKSASLTVGWFLLALHAPLASGAPSSGTRRGPTESAASSTVNHALEQHALQQLRLAKPHRGAIVILRVKDGAVLTAADYPSQQPHAESVLWSALTPSASLFKLVTTAALVEDAQLRPDHRICSAGGEHRVEAEHLLAPAQGRVRCQPFSTILATSRNAAYARLAAKYLDAEVLTDYATRFGFNETLPGPSPIELGRFRSATEPLPLARTATGFIGSKLSVFGAANLGLVIASGGAKRTLHLTCSADPVERSSEEQVLKASTVQRLREMMESVVAHGTAYDAFHDEHGRPRVPHLKIAAKTGTLGSNEGTHSWFTGFAPSRKPEIVVAVLLENGNVFRTTAKAIAAEVLRNYFDGERAGTESIKLACGD